MNKKNHKSFKLLTTTLLILSMVLVSSVIIPVKVEAKVTYTGSSSTSSTKKSSRYFSDVKSKTSYRAEIEWLAKKGAFAGIAKKGGKFKPGNIITRRQVGQILDNLYGDRINISISSPNSKATQGFMTSTLELVSKQLGYKVTWSGGAPKAKVTRAKAALYIRQMIKCGGDPLNP